MPDNKQVLYENLMSALGTPYLWAGNNRLTGYDCSGFTLAEFLRPAGLWGDDDASAQGIYDFFSKRTKDHSAGFGSLVFYGKSTTAITHIAVCLTDTTMIEAGGGGSKTTSLEEAKRAGAMVRIRPIHRRPDCVAVLRVLP